MKQGRRVPTGGLHFAPQVLREYALLADGERGAVVGPHGDITWMCAPRWDSGSVFGELIGAEGTYAITPLNRFVWGGYYEDGTLIWRHRWITEDGIIECREALAFPGDQRRAVLLRRLEPIDTAAEVEVVLHPCAAYGRRRARRPQHSDGVWTAEVGDLHLRWCCGTDAAFDDGAGWSARLSVPPGETHNIVLELSDGRLPDDPPDADQLWHSTEAAWRDQVPELSECWTPDDSRHSYAVMRGLTSTGGGMVAAATVALPERADSGRSYDYRYVWIRDQCFAGQGIAAAGPLPLLDDAVRFVTGRLLDDGERLMPAYTSAAERIPDERQLGLPGYPGGGDVVGNHVDHQFQLDAFGEALLLLATAARHDRLDSDGWRAVDIGVAAIEKRWTEPDAGIWELEPRAWTHSRLSCVAGLRAIAAVRPAESRAADRLALADRILAATAAEAVAPAGHWQRAPDDATLDAALLLPALRGALPPDDPRTVQTLRAYLRELTKDGYAYRFRPDDRPLGAAEGAFLLCGFLVAMSLYQQGDHLEAARWFERTRAACGPPQLYSEEYDAQQNQMRGNLPQAFVHALMVETAARLSSA
jgi:GH15 family glucan-1,4-alpha-glucosidase